MDQLVANTTLASHLILAGACSAEVAEELSERAKESWIPLGRILIDTRKLTLRDVSRVLEAQADRPTSLFGEVAVELGLCKGIDIQVAMAWQAANCPHLLDLAINDERVVQSKLMEALRTYIRHAERVMDRMSDALHVVPDKLR